MLKSLVHIYEIPQINRLWLKQIYSYRSYIPEKKEACWIPVPFHLKYRTIYLYVARTFATLLSLQPSVHEFFTQTLSGSDISLPQCHTGRRGRYQKEAKGQLCPKAIARAEIPGWHIWYDAPAPRLEVLQFPLLFKHSVTKCENYILSLSKPRTTSCGLNSFSYFSIS